MPWNYIFGITTVVCLVAFVFAMIDLNQSSKRRNGAKESKSRYVDYYIDSDGTIVYIKKHVNTYVVI